MKQMTQREFISACESHGGSWNKSFSVSWTTGGTYGSCWNDHLTPVSPSAPEELTALDDFLGENFPTITFMQYRSIANAISKNETREGDYYGGCVYGIELSLTYSDLQAKLEDLGLLEIVSAAE